MKQAYTINLKGNEKGIAGQARNDSFYIKQVTLLFSFIIGCSALSFAQKQVRQEIRSGNKEYKKENYNGAEIAYRKALAANARSTDASYNLGNTMYRQGKAQEALEQYQAVINNETDKEKLSKAWHNAGNTFLSAATSKEAAENPKEKQQALQKSIDAYKNALRKNPKDDETRYNLALAQKLMQDQQNQDDNQDQDQQQDQQQQDQKQDQQNQDQKQDEQQDQQEQQQQNPNEMSKENADQILDAMMQEEKNTQEKVKDQQKMQQKNIKRDKNW